MRIKAVGVGVAADDYAGQKYSDVTSKLADASLTGVIATRTGDTMNDDDCVELGEGAVGRGRRLLAGHRHGAAEPELLLGCGVGEDGG